MAAAAAEGVAAVAEVVVVAGERRRRPAMRKRFRPHCLCLASALVLTLMLGPVQGARAAGDRVALIVGNGGYTGLPQLPNPPADARLLGGALAAQGFDVVVSIDTGLADLQRQLAEFRDRAKDAQIALIYFSGHGIQVDGVNYLLPVNAAVRSPDDLEGVAVPLPDLLSAVEAATPRLGVVILDACRNNPLPASMLGDRARTLQPGAGLARMPAQRGMMIAYATAPGQVALDGPPGQNSFFAAALARYIETPGLEIGLLFRKVSERVRDVTGGAQVPWTEAALTAEAAYFNPPEAAPPSSDALAALNTALEAEGSTSQELALARFLNVHGSSPLAPVAREMLRRLTREDASRRRAVTATLEDEFAHWQRVADVAGTRAEPLAIDAFLALHGNGDLAPRARARKAELLPSATPPAPEADELLWPLVELARDPELAASFESLFPDSPKAAFARDLVALGGQQVAALSATRPTDGRPEQERPVTIEAYVGTGPAFVPIPNGPTLVAVLEPPRFGSIMPTAARSLAPSTGATSPGGAAVGPGAGAGGQSAGPELPMRVSALAYQPSVEARDVVDSLVLQVGDNAARHEITVHVDVHPCDRLAGARFDLQGVVAGRYPNEIAAAEAVPACREAVSAFPEVPRFAYELGRALEAAGAYEEATQLYEQAAAAGHTVALSALGGLFENGLGKPQDVDRAAEYYEAAAKAGDPLGMNALGRAYRDAKGRPADRDRAVEWFLEAASRGHTFAYNNLGWLLMNEGDVARAVVLFKASAEANDIYGLNNLAYAYENGAGVAPDLAKAIELYERAALGGQPHAPINLGLIYRDGRPGVPPDPRKAARWFAEAARLGVAWGNVHLAGLYASDAFATGADFEAAAQLLARASADRGEAGALARRAFAALPSRVQVAALQQALGRRGFDPGPADGVMGAKTKRALEAFARTSEPPLAPGTDLLPTLAAVLARVPPGGFGEP